MKQLTFGSLFSGLGAFDLAFEQAGWKPLWQCENDPTARRVLKHHWPDVPLFLDIKEIDGSTIPVPDCIFGGSPCFPAGTLVLCIDGQKPIESVRVGDMVLSHDGQYHRVIDTMKRLSPTVRLSGHGNPEMICTLDHPFFASGGRVKKYKPSAERCRGNWYDMTYQEPRWVPARDMKGKYWSSPRRFPELPIPTPEPIGRERPVAGFGTTEFFWMVGAWIGDGWVQDGQRPKRSPGKRWGKVIICDGKEQADELARCLALTSIRFSRQKEQSTDKFVACSGALARWLTCHFGRYCDGKTIPAWLLGAPPSVRQAVWEGYLYADGCLYNGYLKATTVSKKLAVGIRLLAQTLGYSVSTYKKKPRRRMVIEGRTVTENPSWEMIFHATGRSSFCLGDKRFGLVRDVQPESSRDDVYDITVDSTHSFLADGIVVHNCQGFSVAGRRGGMADERSGLFHEFVRVADSVAPLWLLWENVPGCLSTEEGRDFAAVIGAITGWMPEVPRDGWRNSGFAWGAKRSCCWRVLDAQSVGGCPLHAQERGIGPVPQRRRRVFLVARSGNAGRLAGKTSGRDSERLRGLPVKILLEPEGMCWNPPPRRKKRKETAADAERGAASDSRDEVAYQANGAASFRSGTISLAASDDNGSNQIIFDKYNQQDTGDVTCTLSSGSREHNNAHLPHIAGDADGNVTHALRSEGVDGGKDGTGSGTPIIAFHATQEPISGSVLPAIGRGSEHGQGSIGVVYQMAAEAYIINAAESHAKESHARTGDVARSMDSTGSFAANQGGTVVAFTELGGHATTYKKTSTAASLRTGGGGGEKMANVIASETMIRRLTPTECLRLMALPDDWLSLEPLLSDSACYRLIGNAGAVTVLRWIAERIRQVEEGTLEG